jgi:hypothetical protein
VGTARQIFEVDLLGTAHVIYAFLHVASPGTSVICIASTAAYYVPLPSDLERHLATAPTHSLLDHDGLDPDAAYAYAYAVAKRGNQLRAQAAAAWVRAQAGAAEHRQPRHHRQPDGPR